MKILFKFIYKAYTFLSLRHAPCDGVFCIKANKLYNQNKVKI